MQNDLMNTSCEKNVDGHVKLPDLTGLIVLFFLRILVYSVIYDSGYISLENLLLSWYPYQKIC